MNRTVSAVCGVLVSLFAGCTSKGDFGDVAFATYQSGGTRVVFTTDSNAVVTWRNMSGAPVNGTWSKKGNEITLTPHNPRLEPMKFPLSDVKIYGKVVTVLRRL